MTVAELIKELQDIPDQDAKVSIVDEDTLRLAEIEAIVHAPRTVVVYVHLLQSHPLLRRML